MNGYGPPMADAQTAPAETPLKRAIGAKLLLVFVIGDVLGAGIYALVGEVSAEVGGAIWTAFTAALVLAGLTAFAYAELVTKYPHGGGLCTVRQSRVRQALLHLHGRVRRDVLGDRLGGHALAGVRRRLLPGVPDREPGHRGAGLHRGRGRREPARDLGVGQGQHGPDRGRGHRPAADRDHRRRRTVPGRGRLLAQLRVPRGGERRRRPGRRHVAGLLRPDRVRGRGQRGRGDQGPLARVPAGAVPGPGHRGRDLPAGDHDRLDGGVHRRPGRVRRRAAGGGAGGAAGHPDQAVLVHRAAGGGQRRPDQHDHGLAAGLRHVAPGHRAAGRSAARCRPARRPTSPSSSPRCWPRS